MATTSDEETGPVEFKLEEPKRVYPVLSEHQRTENGWELRELVAFLQQYASLFNSSFGLGLTEIAIRVDWLDPQCNGHFRRGFNGFGLEAEIAINRHHLNREPYQILGTLFHEMLHAWQEKFGRPGKGNYHNKQFRAKAESFGLVINTKGQTQFKPDSPFLRLLAANGVNMPRLSPKIAKRVVAPTKLRKWSCECEPPVNVRVAVKSFDAICLHCCKQFQLQGEPLKSSDPSGKK